jgi:broad specificity phosphatase PhoE
MKFILLFCGLLTLALPASTFAESPHGGSFIALKNAVILIIRHAEEPDDGNGLSAAGEAHAEAYVKYFNDFTIDGAPFKVDYLFAAADSRNSQRPRLTVEPTARDMGLTIDLRFKNKNFLELVDEIQSRSHGKNIMICWHHGKIPQLLSALGADPERLLRNGRWPGDEFDWLIELRYDQNGHLLESRRIEEHLSAK